MPLTLLIFPVFPIDLSYELYLLVLKSSSCNLHLVSTDMLNSWILYLPFSRQFYVFCICLGSYAEDDAKTIWIATFVGCMRRTSLADLSSLTQDSYRLRVNYAKDLNWPFLVLGKVLVSVCILLRNTLGANHLQALHIDSFPNWALLALPSDISSWAFIEYLQLPVKLKYVTITIDD